GRSPPPAAAPRRAHRVRAARGRILRQRGALPPQRRPRLPHLPRRAHPLVRHAGRPGAAQPPAGTGGPAASRPLTTATGSVVPSGSSQRFSIHQVHPAAAHGVTRAEAAPGSSAGVTPSATMSRSGLPPCSVSHARTARASSRSASRPAGLCRRNTPPPPPPPPHRLRPRPPPPPPDRDPPGDRAYRPDEIVTIALEVVVLPVVAQPAVPQCPDEIDSLV